MTTSPKGIALLKSLESCKLQSYQDSKGVWTIGYGHTTNVVEGMSCAQAEADIWLVQDLVETEGKVSRVVKVPLSQNQFDALVCFTFNVGHVGETMLKKLNFGDYSGAAGEFQRWIKSANKVVRGLENRRLREMELFEGKEDDKDVR